MDTTSSLIAIVDLSFKVIKYMNDVRDGGKERSELHQEVLTVYDIFWNIKSDFESPSLDETTPWSEAIKPLFKPNGTIEQLKQVLVQIAAKITIAPQHTPAGVIKKLKWPFEKSEVQRILSRLRSYKDTISVALNRANLQLGIKTKEDVQFMRHAFENDELKTALDWISPLDFLTLQRASQRQPLRGTGEWFLNNPQIRGWCDGRTKAVWCHGIPGAGKTVLATTLFQELQKTLAHDKVAVLIAYCSFDDPNTHSADNMLSSLLRQLVESRGQMSDAVRNLYYEHTRNREKQRPSREALVSTFSKELENFDQTFIIVDGLDELRDNKQKAELLGGIESLQPTPQLLVTSRPVEAVDTWFKTSAKLDGGYRVDDDDDENPQALFYCDNCEWRSSAGDSPSDDDDDESLVLVQSEQEEDKVVTTGEPKDWKASSSYRCENCYRDVCVNCYDQYDVCFGCSGSKECFKWAWPGTVPIAAQPEDLERYILWRIEMSDNLQVLLQHAKARGHVTSESIVARVQEESHKMFLLAKFHMNALEEQATARDLLNTLKQLPSNINDIYASLFHRIGNRRLASTLERFLTVVATARKLLSTKALAHAVTARPGDEDIDELALPDVRYLASMCAGLVEIDPSGYVRLAHETIGHYIAETGLKSSKSGHTLLAEVCLTYLQFAEFASGASYGPDRDFEVKDRQERYPFLTYAATHWGIHMRHAHAQLLVGPSDDTNHKLAEAFLSKSGSVSTSGQFMWLDDLETSSGWGAEYGVHGLHLAAYFGLASAVPTLLASNVNADVTDCMDTTPLMYATQAGHADIVHILLHSGADPGKCCRRGRTVLHRACERSAVDIVKQLVASPKEILVNEFDQPPYKWTALTWAIMNGRPKIVKLLLTRKEIDLDLQCPGDFNLNALHRAVADDELEIAELILADGRISIESMDPDRTTPLILAASSGYDEMVSLLLKWGANPNARDVFDGPAILRAVDNNALECVRALVSHGADYKFKDFHGRGILHGAAINARSTILRFLLSYVDDLDPNIQGDDGETPLHDAVKRNSESTVRVLLEHGARTDIENRHGKSPLRQARDECNTRLFDILSAARLKEIPAGQPSSHNKESIGDTTLFVAPNRASTLAADYKTPSKPPSSLLYRSLQWSRPDSLRILLDRGADIDLTTKWGATALHGAASFDEYEAAELLIARGCNLDIRDLLHRLRKPAFAFLFVKHGAAISADERDALLPTLNFAVDRNDLAVVRRLVEEGVPFLVKDSRNQTPYQRARRAGFDEIAQYLYDKARSGGGRGGLGHATSISSVTLREETVPDVEEGAAVGDDDAAALVSKGTVPSSKTLPEVAVFRSTEKHPLPPKMKEEEEDKTAKKPLDGEDLQDTFTKMRREILAEISIKSAVGGRSGMTDREMILVGVIGLLIMVLLLR
ncbi:hypothetical protein PG993_003870 [Apiospora rasikravindrae]|uniref:NACHT domain-containing protein n=1 Tax=Apiospora rasikravindrae TaxID=990691 RepID=A0ABR1U0R6_9PEZI